MSSSVSPLVARESGTPFPAIFVFCSGFAPSRLLALALALSAPFFLADPCNGKNGINHPKTRLEGDQANVNNQIDRIKPAKELPTHAPIHAYMNRVN